jgi:hypothetical protein
MLPWARHLRLGAVIAVSCVPALAHAADPPRLAASMQCERGSQAGRVRCSVEARAEPGLSIAWADVVLVGLPEFASALKGRVSNQDATAREPGRFQWAFGLVAKKTGQGSVRARVRAVLCPEVEAPAPATSRCVPIVADVETTLSVGG